ncbi:glycosyltransferase family 4 protein [Nocardioides taihuensis]|uniref:Glycosyltransferase family 4 protein n=1 Tax=Nocardioides taihuensis TaxID=1835606 RepID=A0ABW0BNP7_9ACTN
MPQDAATLAGKHVVFLSWRDSGNPEGGGAERYLEKMAEGLVERGCRVTVFSAAYAAAADQEVHDGIRFVRRGSKMSVYARGMEQLLRGRFGKVDLVVDVQNGLPFFSPVVTRVPVVVLVYHVHREQWPIVYPGTTGRVGWWIESELAPRLYRKRQYVTISRATMGELEELGVRPRQIAVVHTGTDPVLEVGPNRSPHPTLCVVGRLVPHKRVEHAIATVVDLRREFPDIRLHVVGDGWWAPTLKEYAAELDAGDTVVFEGQVSEERKQEIYEAAWLQLLPSIKEGWGLVVGEAAQHGTPTVAYAASGGTRESIQDGVSGVLVDSRDEMVATTRKLLSDPALLATFSESARRYSGGFTWEESQSAFAHVLASALRGEVVASQDVPER